MHRESSSRRPRGQGLPRRSRRLAARGAILESEQHEARLAEIDDTFVRFLFDYAANATECPPLFKTFLEEEVLKPGTSDLTRRVQAYFRNPQIKEYDLGPVFIREIEKYPAYDLIYRGIESDGHFAQIPERYLPRPPGISTQLSPREPADLETGATSLDVGAQLGVHDDEELLREPDRGADTPPPEHDADEEDLGPPTMISRLNTMERLFRSPIIDPIDGATDRTGPDWVTDSWYRGRRQPPLAVRLQTIINFLADEDVDRCIDWAAKFGQVVDYLEWLVFHDERDQLRNAASPQTRAMFNDAVAKAKAHALFERHHSAPTPMEAVRKQPSPPLMSTRLGRVVNGHGGSLQYRNAARGRSDLLPRPIPPRPASPVNRMLVERPADRPIYSAFASDEKEWWQNAALQGPGRAPLAPGNLAVIENETFNSFINNNGERDEVNPGWVRIDPATGQTTLPDGIALPRGDPQSWARERGARRAGLQQLLQTIPTGLPSADNTPWRRPIILPTPAAALRRARETVDNPQWKPPALDRDQLPAELETMPQTVAYHARLGQIKATGELARLNVKDQNELEQAFTRRRRRGWVNLPRNLVNGGPYVWCMDDADAEEVRVLLKQSRTTVEVLKAAYIREPRPLLKAVLQMLDRAEQGEFLNHAVPGDVTLAADEWELDGQMRVPALVDSEDDQWLRFLAGECVNRANWTGKLGKETQKGKDRLFLIFAARIRKLLDDKNPQGLFSRHDAQVEVDSLLPVINAGKGGGIVTKYEFNSSEACRWLDRMKESGHVRFYLDPACYGVVGRPKAEFFPEHRVLWPTPDDDLERPSYYRRCISDWGSIIKEDRIPDISEGSPIWNFFLSFAFRLGYTISQLKQQELASSYIPRPSRQNLHAAISDWELARSNLETSDLQPADDELAAIRTAIIDEASANETMLAPGRARVYYDAAGAAHTVLERDHNWDWASLPARNHTRRHKFWSIDRWPLGAGRLSESAERAVREDAHLDPAMTYDPVEAAGPIDERYTRPKLRPYLEEKVVFRAGPAVYPVGDTRLQREALRERMTEMVAVEMGLEREPSSRFSILANLANLNPFSCPSSRAGAREEQGALPPVDPKAVPRSWDPVAEAERREQERIEAEQRRREEQEEEERGGGDRGHEAQGEGGDDNDIQSVDILMTGMGRHGWLLDTFADEYGCAF